MLVIATITLGLRLPSFGLGQQPQQLEQALLAQAATDDARATLQAFEELERAAPTRADLLDNAADAAVLNGRWALIATIAGTVGEDDLATSGVSGVVNPKPALTQILTPSPTPAAITAPTLTLTRSTRAGCLSTPRPLPSRYRWLTSPAAASPTKSSSICRSASAARTCAWRVASSARRRPRPGAARWSSLTLLSSSRPHSWCEMALQHSGPRGFSARGAPTRQERSLDRPGDLSGAVRPVLACPKLERVLYFRDNRPRAGDCSRLAGSSR